MSFCSNCGEKLNDNDKFCASCGCKVSFGQLKMQLRCQSCNGVMDFDKDKDVLFCPYCGSKELLQVSDAVKIEQIRSKMTRDIEFGNQDVERTKQLVYRDVEVSRAKAEKRLELVSAILNFFKSEGPLAIFLIGLVLYIISSIFSIQNISALSILIMLASGVFAIIKGIGKVLKWIFS